MKHILGLTLAATLWAGQASALSCVRPDVAQSFQHVAASSDVYVVLLGEFSFNAPLSQGATLNRVDVQLPARFTGQYLGPERFVNGQDLNVTLNFTCAASWCGSMASGEDGTLAFARQTSQGYVLDVGPCGGRVFANATPHQVQRVEACVRGESCEIGNILR